MGMGNVNDMADAGKCDTDIWRHVGIVKDVFHKLSTILIEEYFEREK